MDTQGLEIRISRNRGNGQNFTTLNIKQHGISFLTLMHTPCGEPILSQHGSPTTMLGGFDGYICRTAMLGSICEYAKKLRKDTEKLSSDGTPTLPYDKALAISAMHHAKKWGIHYTLDEDVSKEDKLTTNGRYPLVMLTFVISITRGMTMGGFNVEIAGMKLASGEMSALNLNYFRYNPEPSPTLDVANVAGKLTRKINTRWIELLQQEGVRPSLCLDLSQAATWDKCLVLAAIEQVSEWNKSSDLMTLDWTCGLRLCRDDRYSPETSNLLHYDTTEIEALHPEVRFR